MKRRNAAHTAYRNALLVKLDLMNAPEGTPNSEGEDEWSRLGLLGQELARLRRIEAAAIAFRRAESAGGACDVETTYRLQQRVDAAREALDAALGGVA